MPTGSCSARCSRERTACQPCADDPDRNAERASAGVGKVDLHGLRGVTLVSAAEIEAMALVLAVLGVVPTIPGKAPPPTFFLQD